MKDQNKELVFLKDKIEKPSGKLTREKSEKIQIDSEMKKMLQLFGTMIPYQRNIKDH